MVNQMAVFMENREGRILELTKVLKKNNIDLVTLSIADTKDFGILRCITRDNKKASEVLRAAGFTVSCTDLIGIEVKDEPGEFADVLMILDKHGINVEYLYSFVTTYKKTAIILFKVADNALAAKILIENGVKLLDNSIII